MEIGITKVIQILIILFVVTVLIMFGIKNYPTLTKSLLGYDPFAGIDKELQETKLEPEAKAKVFNFFLTELENCKKSKTRDCKCKLSPNQIPPGHYLSFERTGTNTNIGLHNGVVERRFIGGLTPQKIERQSPDMKQLKTTWMLTPKFPDDPSFSSALTNYLYEDEFYITYDKGSLIVMTSKDRQVMDFMFSGIYRKTGNELYILPPGTTLSSAKECELKAQLAT